jgi:hypothetical protein
MDRGERERGEIERQGYERGSREERGGEMFLKGDIFLNFFYILYSTLLHLPPFGLRRWMLGSNPGLLHLLHWQ